MTAPRADTTAVLGSEHGCSTQQVFQNALELGVKERTELLALLIDSLDAGTEAGVEEAWMQEIDQRIAQLDSGAVQTEAWEVVRNRLNRAPGD